MPLPVSMEGAGLRISIESVDRPFARPFRPCSMQVGFGAGRAEYVGGGSERPTGLVEP